MTESWKFSAGDAVPDWFQSMANCTAVFASDCFMWEECGARYVVAAQDDATVSITAIEADAPVIFRAVRPTVWLGGCEAA